MFLTSLDFVSDSPNTMLSLYFSVFITELNSKLGETSYEIIRGGSLAIRNQRVIKKLDTINIQAGFKTTGGGANTLYNGGTIPREIYPYTDTPFIVLVTDGGWALKGLGTIIFRTSGAIQYQVDFAFTSDMYLWLNASYKA